MRCNRCKGRLVCVACAGRKGGAARVAKGFAKTGGARAAALRRWALQREDQRIAGGQVAAFVAAVEKKQRTGDVEK